MQFGFIFDPVDAFYSFSAPLLWPAPPSALRGAQPGLYRLEVHVPRRLWRGQTQTYGYTGFIVILYLYSRGRAARVRRACYRSQRLLLRVGSVARWKGSSHRTVCPIAPYTPRLYGRFPGYFLYKENTIFSWQLFGGVWNTYKQASPHTAGLKPFNIYAIKLRDRPHGSVGRGPM